MKSVCLLFPVLCFLLSCSAENDAVKDSSKTEWVSINGHWVKKTDVELPRPKGVLPYGHKVYSFLNSELSINEQDKIYRQEFAHPDSLKLDYNATLKSVGFVFMMGNGLPEKGTPEQKQYYLNEQLNAPEYAFPDIDRFYTLLNSCFAEMDKSELLSLEEKFYSKSHKRYKATEEPLGKKGLDNLALKHKDFKNALAMK